MKKILTLAVMVSLCLALASCGKKAQPIAISTPDFFDNLGKTLNTLKSEHPGAVLTEDGFPWAGIQCLGDPADTYANFFFGSQQYGWEHLANEYGDDLKCAGFLTTTGVLFPEIQDEMPVKDFFASLGVSDYRYDTEGPSEGWVSFTYKDMNVWINTIEDEEILKKITTIKRSYPVFIYDLNIEKGNQDIIATATFG
jgi:hypothetical protein